MQTVGFAEIQQRESVTEYQRVAPGVFDDLPKGRVQLAKLRHIFFGACRIDFGVLPVSLA